MLCHPLHSTAVISIDEGHDCIRSWSICEAIVRCDLLTRIYCSLRAFFYDFADVVECIAVCVAPTIIVGDVNIHLDDVSASHTVQFNDSLDGADLVQHVAGPTHRTGHTRDVVITQNATEVFVSVEPLSMSDHSLIVANIVPGHTIQSVSATIIKWTQINVDKFEKELTVSDLITSPPTDCWEYITNYDKTLRELLDKHAPLKSNVQRSHATAPWFNPLCWQVKVRTRSLEKFYLLPHIGNGGSSPMSSDVCSNRELFWLEDTVVKAEHFVAANSHQNGTALGEWLRKLF